MHYSSSGNVAERLLVTGERTFATLRQSANDSLLASEFPLDRVDDPPRVLSGGMQQRVQLAKAIALKPELLLLDEPAAGVTETDRLELLKTIAELPKDVTVLLIEHDMDLVFSFARRMTVLVNGAVLTEGDPQQIANDPEVRAVYLGTTETTHG